MRIKNPVRILFLLSLMVIPMLGFASDPEEGEKFDPKELINEHVWDSHEFHVADWDGHPITLSLPVILWADNGLTIFSSSKFHHDNEGEHIVEANGHEFVRYKEHIFYADKFDKENFESLSTMARPFLYDQRPLDFSITKSVFSMFFSAILILLIFGFAAKAYSNRKKNKAPKGIAAFMEPLILFVRDDIAKPNV
ncbi:MAG: F0F1 ATP synthase subunit A, partial [Leeuwenhoekiella sp.]